MQLGREHRAALRPDKDLQAVSRAELLAPLEARAARLRLKSTALDRARLASVNQWRICFRWRDGDAYEVESVDYH